MLSRKPLQWIAGIAHTLRRQAHFGVRTIALNDARRVFLVRHTYAEGWHLPGGGVDAGETAAQAAQRELWEEGRLEPTRLLSFIGFFLNPRGDRRGHVILYAAEDCRKIAPKQPDREIAETGFFAYDVLPATTTPATRARLIEYFQNQPPSAFW